MRVVLHGFGSFPIVFWHMIQHARSIDAPIDWAIILTTDHHRELFVKLLGAECVTVLNHAGTERYPGTSDLAYPGALYRDIEAEKRTFKYAPAGKQYARAMSLYRQVRDFMRGFGPTHALVSQVEGFDGKVFIAAAREYGAEVVVPTSCRNLGGTFFSPDDVESLPVYANGGEECDRASAQAFIENFRHAPKPARWSPDVSGDEVLDAFVPPMPVRAVAAARRWLTTPGGFQWDYLRASFLNNVPFLRDAIWATRRRANERHCDIRSLDELPRKFIFYPLQYTPESSINTPAPYFLDQFRAIDAIRFAMPSDCVLVVKEHPACILIRESGFVRRLQRTGGVVVAHYALSSVELVKRAGLTISVTGTATLEAMVLGRRAITLGGSLVSGFLGGACSLGELGERIEQAFDAKMPDAEVKAAIATLFNARYEVLFGAPGTPGEPVLRRRNIASLTEAFIDHCRRVPLAANHSS
jgi:hypothetical protein